MEGSMSLKKRAIEGIVVAGSLVMMSTIAQAADLDGVQVRNAAVQAETDFATVGTAGVVARLDQLEAEAFGDIEAATAGVNQTGRLLVATAEEAVSDTEAAETLDAQLQQAEATEAQQADAEQSETEAAQSQADGEQTADAEQTDAGGQPEDAQSTDADQMSAEEQEWQNPPDGRCRRFPVYQGIRRPRMQRLSANYTREMWQRSPRLVIPGHMWNPET